MIVQIHTQYHANDKDDAVAQAQDVWRKFINDPQAELPWATTLHVQPTDAEITLPTLSSGQVSDPRPFFVDLIIKETRPETVVGASG